MARKKRENKPLGLQNQIVSVILRSQKQSYFHEAIIEDEKIKSYFNKPNTTIYVNFFKLLFVNFATNRIA